MDFLVKNGQIWPKTGSFGQIWAIVASCPTKKRCEQVAQVHFWSFLGQILSFLAHFVPRPTKNNANKVPRCFFLVMWVPKLLLSLVKIKIFLRQKRPNLARNGQFWSFWARPCRLIWCPVGGLVGGCGARAVSRKTPIYFIYFTYIVAKSS